MRDRGTTLVELITVLTIIALLAGLAWPGYARWRERQWRLQAIEALLDIQLQQARAWRRAGRYLPLTGLVRPALPSGARLSVSVSGETGYLAQVELPLPEDRRCRQYAIGPDGPQEVPGASGSECWIRP